MKIIKVKLLISLDLNYFLFKSSIFIQNIKTKTRGFVEFWSKKRDGQ